MECLRFENCWICKLISAIQKYPLLNISKAMGGTALICLCCYFKGSLKLSDIKYDIKYDSKAGKVCQKWHEKSCDVKHLLLKFSYTDSVTSVYIFYSRAPWCKLAFFFNLVFHLHFKPNFILFCPELVTMWSTHFHVIHVYWNQLWSFRHLWLRGFNIEWVYFE